MNRSNVVWLGIAAFFGVIVNNAGCGTMEGRCGNDGDCSSPGSNGGSGTAGAGGAVDPLAADGILTGGFGSMGPGEAVVEDCQNAQDDDNDGTSDCADPHCFDEVICMPKPLALPGWDPLYYRVQISAYGSAKADCPKGTIDAGQTFGEPAFAPECTSCGCKAKNCVMDCFKNVGCQGEHHDVVLGDAVSCRYQDGLNDDDDSCRLLDAQCDVAGGKLVDTPPWGTTVDACQLEITSEAGCGEGGVCIPLDNKLPLCIRYTGTDSVVCPEMFPNKHLTFKKIGKDDRACSCSCAADGCEGAQVRIHNGYSCQDLAPLPSVQVNATCTSFGIYNVDPKWSWGVEAVPTLATCTSQANNSGSVVGDDPVTFCCDTP